jgi:hypothetical protein
MVKLPVRAVELGLASATKETSELPAEPLEVMDSQSGLLLTEPQPQTCGAVTLTDPFPPDAGTLPLEEPRL